MRSRSRNSGRNRHARPGLETLEDGLPRALLHSSKSEPAVAAGAVALVAEGKIKTMADRSATDLVDRPGVVLGRELGLVEGPFLPEVAADHAHAVAVDGSETQTLREELVPVHRVAVAGIGKVGTRGELDQWTVDEKEVWRVALGADPLLLAELLPKGYSGRKAWRLRGTILAKAARMSGRLQPERGPAA